MCTTLQMVKIYIRMIFFYLVVWVGDMIRDGIIMLAHNDIRYDMMMRAYHLPHSIHCFVERCIKFKMNTIDVHP